MRGCETRRTAREDVTGIYVTYRERLCGVSAIKTATAVNTFNLQTPTATHLRMRPSTCLGARL